MGHQQTHHVKHHEAWVVTVDMGYGHQRATDPLRHLSPDGQVIIANDYPDMPRVDYRFWNYGRKLYETVSRLQALPLIGSVVFAIMDSFQAIKEFDPKRRNLRPTAQLLQNYIAIRNGRGKHLIQQLNHRDIPLITSFFTVAYMAEEHHFKNEIYLVVCDTDISRTWAPLHPEKSRIKYVVPTERAKDRLITYGVKPESIFLTGFPLPLENIGGHMMTTLKKDVAARLHNLDPKHSYRSTYKDVIKTILKEYDHETPTHPLTLTYAVGGAGAQKETARDILRSLHNAIVEEKINLCLVAGTRSEVDWYFRRIIEEECLKNKLGKSLHLLYKPTKQAYFESFNQQLRTTDVLWTKPSELVFYSALGIPIIIAPTLGSQEEYNKAWLEKNGAGITASDAKRTHEWFFEWLASGALASTAMNAFMSGESRGVEHIKEVVFGKK